MPHIHVVRQKWLTFDSKTKKNLVAFQTLISKTVMFVWFVVVVVVFFFFCCCFFKKLIYSRMRCLPKRVLFTVRHTVDNAVLANHIVKRYLVLDKI